MKKNLKDLDRDRERVIVAASVERRVRDEIFRQAERLNLTNGEIWRRCVTIGLQRLKRSELPGAEIGD